MSIFDRAVKALNDIDEAIDHLADNTAYVTALEAEGLLAPDLPEPYRPGVFKARRLALALLAACEYTEKEQDSER